MSAIISGVTGPDADAACNQFGLIFDEITSSELLAVSELQSYCNMTNVVLVKAIDGLFVDQCLYVDQGSLIIPGNLTFCYDDPVGALCRLPPETITTTYTSTPSTTAVETSFSIVTSVVTSTVAIEDPSSLTTISTVISGYTTTITDPSGNEISTITVDPSTLMTTMSPPPASISSIHCTSSTHCTTRTHHHHHHHHDDCHRQIRHPDIQCQNDLFAIIENQRGNCRRAACESLNMKIGEITHENFMIAAGFLFQCLGPLKKTWIGSYNGDEYDGYCIALYTGNTGAGGAIAAPNSCNDSLPVLCQKPVIYKSLLQQTENNIACNQTAKGIHIIPGLYNRKQASDLCESLGWSLLDLGNFNLLSFLDLCMTCRVQFGWVRSVHGYMDVDGMLYFAQGPPVLGAAVALSKSPQIADILAPVLCQEQPERPTSTATHSEVSSTVLTSETVIVLATTTSVATIVIPVISQVIEVSE